MKSHSPTPFFTVRSVAFGLLGIVLIAGFSGFHDEVTPGGTAAIGMHLPVAVFGYIFFLGLVWNGLAGALKCKALVLSPRELVFVMVLAFASCFAPVTGLMRYFPRALMMPWHYLGSGGFPEWEKHGILEHGINPNLFPQPVPQRADTGDLIFDDTVYTGFFSGLSADGKLISLSTLPLKAWALPMLYWGPLILLCAFACTALAFTVHRQWSRHEQLSYPIAQVSGFFCHRADALPGVPDLFRRRLFWMGFLPVFLFYLLGYTHLWFPESVPSATSMFPHLKRWDLPVSSVFPALNHTPNAWGLDIQVVYFCVIGLAYFVSAEISLSMGLSGVLLALVGLGFYRSTGRVMSYDDIGYMNAGAYIGYTLVLLYTGRVYYTRILARALRVYSAPDEDRAGVFAARVLLASFAGFVATLAIMGASFWAALCYALLLMMMFLVLTRVVCETGIPFVSTYWWPGQLLALLFGPAMLGPGSLVILLWVSNVLCADPRECLMPFVATGSRLADDARLPLRKMLVALCVAIVIAVAIAFIAQQRMMYSWGAMSDWYSAIHHPQAAFNGIVRHLNATDGHNLYVWQCLLFPALLVVGFSALRFRFSRFPLHPVLFLVLGTYPCCMLWFSFLVGWLVKTLVVKYGGGTAYQRLKPLFVGVIAGEIIFAAIMIVMDMAYYGIHHRVTPALMRILPG